MYLSQEEISEIYLGSLSLNERITLDSFLTCPEDQESNDAQKTLWCDIISQGDQNNFEKRFIWSGIDPGHFGKFLQKVSPNESIPLPSWIKTLDECLYFVSTNRSLINNYDKGWPLTQETIHPFEEILLLFVDFSKEKLRKRLGGEYHILTDSAHFKLEQSLLRWFSQLNSQTMEFEFSIFRTSSRSALSRMCDISVDHTSNSSYTAFIDDLTNGKLADYFKRYTVLARIISQGIEQWIDMLSELIARLKKDKADLEIFFNDCKSLGKICDIDSNLSDRHHNGRCVMALSFETGIKILYKPKSLGIEFAYNQFIDWLNHIDMPVRLRSYKVLDLNDYGWVEFINANPIKGIAEYKEYYRKAGGLLCLVYLLQATDLHHENIIQDGIDPVLIDLETLLHPFADIETVCKEGEKADSIAKNLIIDSILRTGLLPYWNLEEEDQAYDVSGLGEFMPQNLSVNILKWESINTDQMCVKRQKINVYPKEKAKNTTQNNELLLDNFSGDIIQGFTETYQFLIQDKEKILKSPFWQRLSQQVIRFVFRPTRVYSQIQFKLLHPNLLRRGIDRSIHLDILFKGKTNGDAPPNYWPLIHAEQEAMENMDIPHFTTTANTDSIYLLGGGEIKHYFREASFNAAVNRLTKLDVRDLQLQIEFIKGAILCRSADKKHAGDTNHATHTLTRSKSLNKEEALDQAISIAAILKEKAIKAQDGSITWIAPRYYPKASRFQLESISTDLYDGTIGIGLFFSALYNLTRNREYKDLALGSFKIAILRAETADPSVGPLGGFAGFGSYVYSFLKAGLLMGERPLIDLAKKSVSHITEKRLEQDKIYDVVYGTAGVILSLLELYDCTKEHSLISLLRCAGDHLLKERSLTLNGLKAWDTGNGIFLTGFSHGVAGIAYALLRLYNVIPKIEYRNAAMEAIAYENSIFSEKERNWPDLRVPIMQVQKDPEQNRFMCTWCHGATGIGLARLAALNIVDTKDIRKDIQISLETSTKYLNSSIDSVCCGNFGRLELLHTASIKFKDDQLHAHVLEKAGEIINLSKLKGTFRYNSSLGFTPGFFQGISGIGYQILRLTHPEILPSVLTLN